MDFDKLDELISSGDSDALSQFIAENNLVVKDGKLFHRDSDYVNDQVEYWDKRQLVKKINLNSLYGALLNSGCRFFDKRIGQSTTLTGRAIAKHMDAYTNQCLTGEYDHCGETIVYGDTDSCYFSAWPVIEDLVESGEMEWDTDAAIKLYDHIANQVNDSFPEFMHTAFNCDYTRGSLIKCGREVVGLNSLFITKKRYAIMVVDLEGERKDTNGQPGKIKAMGLDLKRSDTPPVIQEFLKDVLHDVLVGKESTEVVDKIVAFKSKFSQLPSWEKGSPKRINKLTYYSDLENQATASGQKARLPGHVRAGYNYNRMLDQHNDNTSMRITDGCKAIVCKLKEHNEYGITSIARPTDETNIPEWFKHLPFDDAIMEETNIDQKVDNLLGVLGWDLRTRTDTKTKFHSLFTFGD